jgi:hypothetical protein
MIVKKIKGFEQYVVCTSGHVYRVLPKGKPRKLKPRKDRDGYLQVNLSKNGILTTKKVHRLVAEAFIPNAKKRDTVNHIDGNKKNNRVENLEWLTRRQNIKKRTGKVRAKKTKTHRSVEARLQTALNLLKSNIKAAKKDLIKILEGTK